MVSEAQKRASKKYREKMIESGKMKRVLIDFYQADIELYEWLQQNKPVATYIKQLIREDMKK